MFSLIITLPSTLPSAAAPCSFVQRGADRRWAHGETAPGAKNLPPGTLARGFLRDGNATRLSAAGPTVNGLAFDSSPPPLRLPPKD
ncbi:MAG: hypothetical protein IPH35_27830 [Rhodoferax sp.]|nr:hypothetical protein [Rhodoferax sp.]